MRVGDLVCVLGGALRWVGMAMESLGCEGCGSAFQVGRVGLFLHFGGGRLGAAVARSGAGATKEMARLGPDTVSLYLYKLKTCRVYDYSIAIRL